MRIKKALKKNKELMKNPQPTKYGKLVQGKFASHDMVSIRNCLVEVRRQISGFSLQYSCMLFTTDKSYGLCTVF